MSRSLTRRRALALGTASAAALGVGALAPHSVAAQTRKSHVHPTDGGQLRVHPVQHASLVLETPGPAIYVDPVGGAERYAELPAPDIILITHEHGDHYDPETLDGLVRQGAVIRTNPAVHDRLPEKLRPYGQPLSTSDRVEIDGVSILAVPAYNTTAERLEYHPPGRDNGYVLGIDGLRVYVAGDTEDTPEMRALENIDIAFVPMNLPYTMSAEQAADGVAAFAPGVVYPYHYRGTDLDRFEERLGTLSDGIEVIRADWYPSS